MHSTVFALLGLIALATAQVQLQSESPSFNAAGRQGCITASANQDGAAVVIQDCGAEPSVNSNWQVSQNTNPQPITVFGGSKCLDVINGADADGTKLQIWSCVPGSTNQQWIALSDSTFQWSGTNKCVDLTNGDTTNGNQLQIWTCDTANTNQKFSPLQSSGGTASYFVSVATYPNPPKMCMTAESNADGALVSIAPCDNVRASFQAGNNTWVFPQESTAGPITTFGGSKCLDIANGDNFNGNTLQIWTCVDGSANQQFTVSPSSRTIAWAVNNKCVDITDSNVNTGTRLPNMTTPDLESSGFVDSDSTAFWAQFSTASQHSPLSLSMTANDGPSTNGFPEGYFIIRSAANKRVLDVGGGAAHDNAEILLWPSKESSLVESRRNPAANNQVFFVDEAGALCSKASGHAVDIEDEKLVLRRRRPITRPYPSHLSHPLPKFSYSEETQEISVTFLCDPNYYDSRSIDYSTSDATWKNKIHLLVSKPKPRNSNIFDAASNFVNNTIASGAYSLFGGGGQRAIAAEPGALAAIGAELGEDEILDEEQGEEAELDDSPDPLRRVRMITTHKRTVDDRNLVHSARNRRRWLVELVSASDARTSGLKYSP
ncbi:hypothetical protein V5O48_011115 [Marasmius crinis-equi]|uniref:Ricin B lectin domain-containing protein n=1 Tax=Marasmius crinis-equi TaxID=585013 RepID=A0ABR3F6M8_9AGAR